ncbi:MAG: ribonuclease Z [Bacteroidales bacterium]|nr:ribonuclease Z [Bacteroidales bacterium]
MNFLVTPLGCGAATPALGRHCSSQIINIDGFKIMLDCGEGTQEQIRRYHQRMQSISTIFISHLHGDHIFGLPGLLSSMHLCGRKEPINIFAPSGLKAALEMFLDTSSVRLQYEIVFHELEVEEPTVVFDNQKCCVIAFPLYHSVPTIGYMIEGRELRPRLRPGVKQSLQLTDQDIQSLMVGNDYTDAEGNVHSNADLLVPPGDGKRYAYCCDTAYNEALLDVLEGVDLLCVDSTFAEDMVQMAAEKQHCTAGQAALLAQKANAKKLLLTHFSARYKDLGVLLGEARSLFAETYLAAEGEMVKL